MTAYTTDQARRDAIRFVKEVCNEGPEFLSYQQRDALIPALSRFAFQIATNAEDATRCDLARGPAVADPAQTTIAEAGLRRPGGRFTRAGMICATDADLADRTHLDPEDWDFARTMNEGRELDADQRAAFRAGFEDRIARVRSRLEGRRS